MDAVPNRFCRLTSKTRWLRVPALLALLILVAFPGVIGVGWGENGHKTVTRLALDFTPEPLRSMLAPYGRELEEAAMDPDRRKSEPGTSDESERHFIDIDALEPYPFKAFPHDLNEAEEKYGKINLHNQGTVPWAITESFNNLVAAWRAGDVEWVRWLGDLSHYVADSHQPFHTTANFDGQKTGNRGIHALLESVMFDGFWKDEYAQAPRQSPSLWLPLGGGVLGLVGGFLLAGPPGAVVGALTGLAGGYLANVMTPSKPEFRPVEDPLEAAFNIIPDSYKLLDPLLRAHNAAQAYRQTNPKFYQTFWSEGTNDIMIQQINKAAYTLARFLMGAWLKAGQPAVVVAKRAPTSSSALPSDTEPQTNAQTIEALVQYAALGKKYFDQMELERLGAEVDLERVPYRADVDLEDILLGCPEADCIPSIDAPRFESTEALWMYDNDLVVGVNFNGEARAYPISVLTRHEIVNDTFSETAVVISYCPLCRSATAFIAPLIAGQIARFGVSGRLYKSDLVMYDRVTYSLWSQIESRVIVGPLAVASPVLQRIPVDIASWGAWKSAHPNTLLLARPTTADAVGGQSALSDDPAKSARLFDYSEDPYRRYQGNDADTYGLEVQDQRLPNKAVVIGVEVEKNAKAYERSVVEQEGLINDTVQGVPIVVVYKADADQVLAFQRPSEKELILEDGVPNENNVQGSWEGNSIVVAGVPLEPIYSLPVYWFAWAAIYPETELYQPALSEGERRMSE